MLRYRSTISEARTLGHAQRARRLAVGRAPFRQPRGRLERRGGGAGRWRRRGTRAWHRGGRAAETGREQARHHVGPGQAVLASRLTICTKARVNCVDLIVMAETLLLTQIAASEQIIVR